MSSFITQFTNYLISLRYTLLSYWIYIKRYWFTALILSLLILTSWKKNININISLQQPVATTTGLNSVEKSSLNSKPKSVSYTSPIDNLTTSNKTQNQLNYINRFVKVAQVEQQKYGIPACITLAQGLLESSAGNSPLAKDFNNHFGIKCFSRNCSKGHCSNFNDDSHKDFFVNYNTAWESYRDHSLLLQKDRYIALKRINKNNYKDWAYGLQKAGYATDPQYAQKIIQLVETLNLQQYN